MSIYCPTDPPELASVLSRIRRKRADYERYSFTHIQGRTLRAFFDLAQEYETLENFYRVCVFVPKEFMGFDSCLYLVDQDTGRVKVACDSLSGLMVCGMDPPQGINISSTPYDTGDSFVAPILGNIRLFSNRPLSKADEVIGLFEVFPLSRFESNDRLFFEKYANRIGYNLHYKIISLQNERHLKFISNLVADIEHNVIVPNMLYKVFFNTLRKKIQNLKHLDNELAEAFKTAEEINCPNKSKLEHIKTSLERLHSELLNGYEEVKKHYRNTSLFLESLLRRDHFEKGQLVLKRRSCRIGKEIVAPQVERYQERFRKKGIKINSVLGEMPDEDTTLAVDLGLLSQVYANLFSNAEKYCEEVRDENGKSHKFISYGMEIIKDFFAPGKHGVKLNVFSTGPHIPQNEARHIFDEGFRGSEASKISGSGHGLHFVKKVINVHGGVVGYEPTHLGNNFYFILPLPDEIDHSMLKKRKPRHQTT